MTTELSDRSRPALPIAMKSNELIVLRGVSGAGKSTLARKLRDQSDRTCLAVIVSADDFFVDGDGNYNFDPSKLGEAHGKCFRGAIESIRWGLDVIVDNTNTTVVEIAPYMALAQAYGLSARIITVTCDVATAVARTQHGVPRTTIERAHANLGNAVLPPWWACETYSDVIESRV